MASDIAAKLNLPDSELVRQTLSSSPFHIVDGVINFRDFGIPPLPSSADEKQPLQVPRVRPGILFRSGELVRLSEKGKSKIKELGITTVFDLRSDVEIRKYQSATPDIPGVRFVHVPVSDTDEYDPMALGARVAKFATDEKNAFTTLYTGILENGGPAYEAILKHMRDKPDEPFLVHCTAGKDRTGIFAAIVQLLFGVPDAAIAHDYHLTTFGLAPVLPALVARFQMESIYRDNWEGFQNMGSARTETMLATLDLIRTKYGGAEGYIRARTSLSSEDVEQIRQNFLCEYLPRGDKEQGVVMNGDTGRPATNVLRTWFAYVFALFGWIWRAVF